MKPKNQLSRRQLLQVGGIGALGLHLPNLLAADAMGQGLDQRGGGGEKSCIFIYQYGGLSQLDSWDPKPLAPSELRGPYQSIATATPGFRVGELMPRLAALSNEYAVIRSMSHGVSVHNRANEMLLAGHSNPRQDAPSFGSIVSKLRPSSASVPPYVWLQKFGGGAAPSESSYLTGGHLGIGHAPLLIGEQHDQNPANPEFRVRAFDTAEEVSSTRLDQRRNLLSELQRPRQFLDKSPPGEALDVFQERSFDLLRGSEARRAFEVAHEPAPLRDRYGRNPLGQNLLLARRLVEAGVRLVSVVAWTGLGVGEKFVSIETWDMHGNAGIGIFDDGWNGLGFALPRADQAVATLLEDLRDRGMLDSTVVALVGEFGRTPVISRGAKAIGRDHWPQCFSAMLAGGGIQGGAVYGESDRTAAFVKNGPVSPADFSATMFAALGINPTARLSNDGFTQPASEGEPIRELLR